MGTDVTIEINRPPSEFFTNYDTVSGTVTLKNTSSLALEDIVVKLEGVVRTSIYVPRTRNNKSKKDERVTQQLKVLYDTMVVFPPENVRNVASSKSFTLNPGTHTFDFSFQIPLYNTPVLNQPVHNQFPDPNAINPGSNHGAYQVRHYKSHVNSLNENFVFFMVPVLNQLNYVEYQLPPSFNHDDGGGRDGSARVSYFVKVTCNRPSAFKINHRESTGFNFRPIDLNPNLGTEAAGTYFRKDVVFVDRLPGSDSNSRKRGFFDSLVGNNPRPQPVTVFGNDGNRYTINPVNVPFALEIRFPNKMALHFGQELPFTLHIVSDVHPLQYTLGETGESNGLGVIYLQSLCVLLVGNTRMAVTDRSSVAYKCTEAHHPIFSEKFDNLKYDLKDCYQQKSKAGANRAYELDIAPSLTDSKFQLNAPPSFRTYTISRTYGLRVVAKFSAVPVAKSSRNAREVETVELLVHEIPLLHGMRPAEQSNGNRRPSVNVKEKPQGAPADLPTYDEVKGPKPAVKPEKGQVPEGFEELPDY